MDTYSQKSFGEMLKSTQKYKDLVTTIEGILAIVFGLVFSIFFVKFAILKPIKEINDLIKDISIVFIPCLIGFLGFIISGLAFVSGTVSLKATRNIYKSNKIQHLESIFFTFYFLGMITGVDIIFFIIILLAALSNAYINAIIMFVFSFLTAYITFFIIFYSIGLLDTCIKIFFVNYQYNIEDE